MVHAPDVRAAPHHIEEPQEICRPGGMSFVWSFSKIRIASLVLLGTATPAIACFLVSGSFVRWLCVTWLAGVALFMRGLGRRAVADTVVLSVDQRGILDHRLMPKHITWQEIEAVCPVDTDCSCVVDIELRWPKVTLGEARWPVRIGAYCQMAYGVPAVTISMLLLDGNVCDLLNAVAQYRPDLLHCKNRDLLRCRSREAPLPAPQRSRFAQATARLHSRTRS